MGNFLKHEKNYQIAFKLRSPTISERVRGDGFFRGKFRPFCLPQEHAGENLYPLIREDAIAFFREKKISWHQGNSGKPINHLCDSQVCAVNFLFAFTNRPAELAKLLKPIFPNYHKMLPVEDALCVSFEWIGNKNYLGERVLGEGTRTRGANFTSADAVVMFENLQGQRQVVLVEWKYTESYPGYYREKWN